ncbi:ATP synthase F1 subunit gamma [Candidatus Gottesmanbacteria bacterium]|nr:ATP synthase F1 subunit gamma [Candidatus Gottesmanbacteria bacterium]MBI5465620.1 ATP synthase F1 subunit gamma [Candidatus Gottesmanbacteria bacterium]
MSNIRQIKRRVKSVQNITQITRAMEMVAASKMKKTQENAVLGKPYAEKIYQATRELADHTEKKFHALLSLGNPAGKLLLVLISTNKGLCGSLNTNLLRMIYQWTKEENVDFVTLGKKGQSFVIRSGQNLLADFSAKTPFRENVSALTSLLVEGFVKGTYREIYLAYNTFLSAFRQVPTKKIILPISSFVSLEKATGPYFSEFLVEPNITDVLENLLPHYLENQVRAAILEAEACEQAARMMAMKNATEAAEDLMTELNLIYNKTRQEKITNEIADMVTARMAVE